MKNYRYIFLIASVVFAFCVQVWAVEPYTVIANVGEDASDDTPKLAR